jgi:FkbM family methyltransferase
VFSFTDNEVYVQAGCCDGNTVKLFIDEYALNNNYKYCYTFEADENRIPACEDTLKDYRNVQIINKGLYSSQTTLEFGRFDDLDMLQTITFNENILIPVISLDLFFADKKDFPTFISLDIEGGELEALKGAEKIIRKYKPKLAISVYHKIEDLYEIPEYLDSLRVGYKFFLRQYSRYFETVLYAITDCCI